MSSRGHGPFLVGPFSKALSVECVRCHAARGDRCYRLTSWVVDETKPGGGFYTERSVRPHAERRPEAPEPDAEPGAPKLGPSRGDLRRKISKLAYEKLPGRDRIEVGRWAWESIRTDGELAAKVAELDAATAVPR